MESKTMIEKTGNSNWREIKNKLFFGSVVLLSSITILPILLIVYKLLAKGLRQINLDFFFKVAPDTLQAMSAVQSVEIIPGGIANGITGTLLMVAVDPDSYSIKHLIGIFYMRQEKYASLIRNLTDILQEFCRIGINSLFLDSKGCDKRIFGFGRKCYTLNHDVTPDHSLHRRNNENDSGLHKEAGLLWCSHHRII